MNQNNSGAWMKATTIIIIIIMSGISVYLYDFLFHFTAPPIEAQLVPLEEIDMASYQELIHKRADEEKILH
ncbi:MAG: hypothetical protein Q8O95_03525 [bacterium]|nr:hypothetical protein [bacterium]